MADVYGQQLKLFQDLARKGVEAQDLYSLKLAILDIRVICPGFRKCMLVMFKLLHKARGLGKLNGQITNLFTKKDVGHTLLNIPKR